ncbi:MAG TPA: 30S ribosomal protein S8 [Elusimicrobiota bacterium]|nr:30S ribosomal protein S8 [Elusimicrobiota bacterium]
MDTIADLLTSIRNAGARFKDRVDVPSSKVKMEIVRILKDEGFIANFKPIYAADTKRGTIRIFLKYSPAKEPVIRGLRRISKPGCRVYRSCSDRLIERGGSVMTIFSTSRGIMTQKEARTKKVGGEVLCQVW